MVRWKNKLSFALVLLLLSAIFLSGCGGSTESSDSTGGGEQTAAPSGSATTTGSDTPAPAEKVKLVVWIWDSAKAALDVNMEDFQKAYPNIEIEWQTMKTGDLYQKYLVAANTGDQVPDVVALETSNLAQMVDIDSLLDITDKVDPYKNKMNQYKWADATKDGKIYAMPWDSGPVVMFYRTDLFQQAGLPTDPKEVAQRIATFADYEDAAKIIKAKTGAYINSDSKTKSNNRFFETMMWQRGLWYFDEQGKVTLDSPEVVETGQYLVDLTNNGYIYDAEPWSDAWLNAYKDGKVATIVGASWFDGLLQTWIAPDSVGKWAVAPMPKWSPDDKYASANDGGSNLSINKNSKHPREAWEFIEFMLGKESSQLKMLNDQGFFPALESTYSDPAYQNPVEYFGGQPIRSIFVEAVKQVKPLAYTKDFPLANQLMTDAFGQIFLKNKTVEEVFKSTADELRKKTDRQ